MTDGQEKTNSADCDHSEIETPKCWACFDEIKEGQKFCTNCSNWQAKWRSKLTLSSTFLSLVVALAAIFTNIIGQVVHAAQGDPDPSFYVFGEIAKDWREIDLNVENLNDFDRVLPFLLNCKPFGSMADSSTGLMRFYNSSSTLIRGEKSLKISYKVDPKTTLSNVEDVSALPMSGLNCSGQLGGGDAEFKLNIVFNNIQSIRFSLGEN